MGAKVFAEFPDLVAEADAVLGYSIEELCLRDPRSELNRTRFTQPALFVVNALEHLKRTRGGAGDVAFFAGHSLGEYNALWAAGVFDFSTGVRLVRRRGELMDGVTGGAMAAVVGCSPERVRAVLDGNGLDELDTANVNAPDQVVVSGPREAVARAEGVFRAAGARAYHVLRTSGAFHSRYMESARREFERYLAACELRAPTTPVVANVTALPYEADTLRHTLAEQLVRPVQWVQTVRYLIAQGAVDLEEAGPGRVLTKLVSRIREAQEADDAPAGRRPPDPGAPHPDARRAAPEAVPEAAPMAEGPPLTGELLGSAAFRETYGVRYAYVCGSMYRGIASEDLVVRAAKAGILAFYGTGGLEPGRVDAAVTRIMSRVGAGAPFGMNLAHHPARPGTEDEIARLLLRRGVRVVEASAFPTITRALVLYRAAGLATDARGAVLIRNRIIAKLSRPEVAESFLSPPPEHLLRDLLADELITGEQARLAAGVPMADDLCVEADCGGHTDRGDQTVLLPAVRRLRDRMMRTHGYATTVRVGAAGGIGTPEAAAAAFVLGADFVLTGSINLCTVESGMSPVVKDMLERIDVQDTDYAPAGDLFELGAQVQVLKRGVFFPGRARRLHELYRRHGSWDDIDRETRTLIETRYFGRTFDEVWKDTVAYFEERDRHEIEKAQRDPKHKMALVFRWYFGYSRDAALEGDEERRMNFQVHCGPALGAFNQWVRDTPLHRWRDRHVDRIAERLMDETAELLRSALATGVSR